MTIVDYRKYWKTIKKYTYVSFDIFDTLIKRNVKTPLDVFDLVQEKYNTFYPNLKITDFKESRCHAERIAREKSNEEEISINEIYQNLLYPKKVCKELLKIEIETELTVCVPNYPIRTLYNKCLSEGKKILITSDMYLPETVIRNILHKCGYEGEYQLFLSSSIKLQKATGNLFLYIIKKLNISHKEIVHIGDSKKADFYFAMKAGVHSILIDRKINNTNFVKGELLNSEPYIFINNTLPKYTLKSNIFQWGYEAFGPLILGFCTWIHTLYLKKKIGQMYFLARDMNVFFKIYEEMYPNDSVKYLEVSRRSLRVSYILKQGRLNAIFDTMARTEYTIEQICNSVGIEINDIFSHTEDDFDIDFNNVLPDENTKEYKTLESIVLKILKNNKDYTMDYLKAMGFMDNPKIAIVDIGWHCTIQNMLETVTERKICGLYFGSTVRNYFSLMDTNGYWFDSCDEYSILPKLTMISVLEVMLFPKIGTTIGYEADGDKVIPIYGPCEMNNNSFHLVKDFQNGGLQFVKDYCDTCLSNFGNFGADIAVAAYEKLAFQPSLEQANLIGNLPYEEGVVLKLAGKRSNREYFKSPKKFFEDYRLAKWKTGFIKRVFPFIRKPHVIDSIIKNRNKK